MGDQELARQIAGEIVARNAEPVLRFALEQGGDLVLWGDCGVGSFFINREALRRRDFSRVAYNWDCC